MSNSKNLETESPDGESEAEEASGRRRFMGRLAVILGGGLFASLAYPILKFVGAPIGKATVVEPSGAIDAVGLGELPTDGVPLQVRLVGSGVRDAWAVSGEVALGAAWVRKTESGQVVALSATCPHLGCAIDFNESERQFECPCHRSAFDLEGKKMTGPAKRGLDPLPVEVADGRVRIKYLRFKQDIAEREIAG